MRALAGGLVVSVICAVPLFAHERDRSLERIGLALQQQPLPAVRGTAPPGTDSPKTLGIFTLVPPGMRGEAIRVSVPIGELVSRAIKGTAAANRRRREVAARRQVDAEIRSLEAPPSSPKP